MLRDLAASLGWVTILPQPTSPLLQTLSSTAPTLMVLSMGLRCRSALHTTWSETQRLALRLLSNQHRCRTRATDSFQTACQPQHLQRATLTRSAVSAEGRALKLATSEHRASSQSVLMPTSCHRLRMLLRYPGSLPALGRLLAMSVDTAQRYYLARRV